MQLTPLLQAFKLGHTTPSAYLQSCLARIAKKETAIHAFAHIDIETAITQAEQSTLRYQQGRAYSAIDGIPLGIKDIIATYDMPTCMGSPIYTGWQSKRDALAVDALRRAGTIILGKTHTTEFAYGRAAPTKNPFNTAHTPGGSSSGTAAGVAAGFFPAGLATQTQGSILRPASYCGAFGYKPSHQLLSLEGIHPVSSSHDHLGVIANSLDLAWEMSKCIAQASSPTAAAVYANLMPPSQPPRLALLHTLAWGELNSKEREVFDTRIQTWRQSGIEVVDQYSDPDLAKFCQHLEQISQLSAEMVAADMAWPYLQYVERHAMQLSEKIKNAVTLGKTVAADHYLSLLRHRAELQHQAKRLAQKYELFVLPAASGVAPIGLSNTGSRSLLVYASFLGLPALSLPILEVAGLPMGVQLIGHWHQDHALFHYGHYLYQLSTQESHDETYFAD